MDTRNQATGLAKSFKKELHQFLMEMTDLELKAAIPKKLFTSAQLMFLAEFVNQLKSNHTICVTTNDCVKVDWFIPASCRTIFETYLRFHMQLIENEDYFFMEKPRLKTTDPAQYQLVFRVSQSICERLTTWSTNQHKEDVDEKNLRPGSRQ